MSESVVVLGSQWGDEGKGKVIDWLSEKADVVVRFQGGHNAGHTLVVGGETIKLNLVPSGVLRPNVLCLIGNGVVISPSKLISEIELFDARGLELSSRLKVSPACPLVMPYHAAVDAARENALGESAIGTLKLGIGPAYGDKAARRALRVGDLADPKLAKERLERVLDYHNFILKTYYQVATLSLEQIFTDSMKFAEKINPLVTDVADLLYRLRGEGKSILFEGAQGTLLDIDHGTYPYVTSSNTTAGAVATGCGYGPRYIDKVIGVTKAYTTRVGGGPFPTELTDATGDLLAERGHEFGTVSGRQRRCGWVDAVALRRAVIVNSLSELCITKLDVLDGLPEVKIGVGYRLRGQDLTTMPAIAEDFSACEPIYETFPGWTENTAGLTDWNAFPANAKTFLKRIEALLDVPVTSISTGPEREAITLVK